MASEWLGVVGTAIGAGIGGVVTVASLIVKGRQDEAAEARRNRREDQQRAEDRLLSVKQQNVDERRSLYARLIQSADELDAAVRHVMSRIHSTDDQGKQEDITEADTCLTEFEIEMSKTTVVAVNRDVVAAARRVANIAQLVIAAVEFTSAANLNEDEVGRYQKMLSTQLIPTLTDACRRDLDYDSPPEAEERAAES